MADTPSGIALNDGRRLPRLLPCLCAWCVVRGAWCVVCGAWCVVRGAWCVVRMHALVCGSAMAARVRVRVRVRGRGRGRGRVRGRSWSAGSAASVPAKLPTRRALV